MQPERGLSATFWTRQPFLRFLSHFGDLSQNSSSDFCTNIHAD
jgi:hypothetical protein